MEGLFALSACAVFWTALIIAALKWTWAAVVLTIVLSTIGLVLISFIIIQIIHIKNDDDYS